MTPSPAPPDSPDSPDSTADSTTGAQPQSAPRIEGYDAVASLLDDSSVAWSIGNGPRLALSRRGTIRLTADGADLPAAFPHDFDPIRRLKVVEDTDRPRVIVDEGGVRLLLYVDRADVQPVIVRRAPLRPKAGFTFADPPKQGHVVLEPGAWVVIETPGDEEVEVKLLREDTDYSGWIDAEAVGTVAHDAPAELQGAPWYTRRKTSLRSRPGAKALTSIEHDERVYAPSTRVTKGHRLVHYRPPCEDEISYVGFVKTSALYHPEGGFGYGCGRGQSGYRRRFGALEDQPRVEVDAGRFLLDVDEPVVVGCLLRPTTLANPGGGTLAVATVWGPIRVRLAPAEFGGQCGQPPKPAVKEKRAKEPAAPGLARRSMPGLRPAAP